MITAAMILAAILEARGWAGPMTASQIAKRHGCTPTEAWHALKALKREGRASLSVEDGRVLWTVLP